MVVSRPLGRLWRPRLRPACGHGQPPTRTTSNRRRRRGPRRAGAGRGNALTPSPGPTSGLCVAAPRSTVGYRLAATGGLDEEVSVLAASVASLRLCRGTPHTAEWPDLVGFDRWTGSRTNSTHPGVHWTVTQTDEPVRSCSRSNDQGKRALLSGCPSPDDARGRLRAPSPQGQARPPTGVLVRPRVVGYSSRPGVDRFRTVKVQVRGRVWASARPRFCQTGPPCSVCSDERKRTRTALELRLRGRGFSPGLHKRCGAGACWAHRSRDSNSCRPGSVRI